MHTDKKVTFEMHKWYILGNCHYLSAKSYFCESGSSSVTNRIFGDDPLWEGQGCSSGETCCCLNNPPLFCRQAAASSDNVKLLLVLRSLDEDILLELVKLFVQ